MKKNFLFPSLFVATVLTIAYLFHQAPQAEKTESQLFQESRTAYATLDARIARCTPANFQYDFLDSTKQRAPLFDNLGELHYSISKANKDAQAFFDQGLRLAYAFNHAEAHRSFMEAARLAPDAGMAHWGAAYALGPNINDPVPDDERKKHAYEAVQKAKENASQLSPKEQDLINALSKRYSANPEDDLQALNQTYSDAMKAVAKKYPNDDNIQILYADAVMNTMPWNYWNNDGEPNPGIAEAKAALEKAIEINPDNPGAHHLYIHMVELPYPDLGVPSAEKLASLMPGAGHLVHMPSHILIRVGRYKEAAQANIDAITADEDYISQCYSQGMYPLGYYPHNIHFLWSAATLLGDSKTAIEAAKKTAEKVPAGELTTLTFLQDYASTPILAYTRFGKWNDILTIPHPGDKIKHVALIRHYGRGIAFIRKDNLKEAEEELQAIERLRDDPELESLIANYTNPSSAIAKVAYEVVAGEIAAAKGNYEEAIDHLKQGIAYEDALTYSEPAPWHIPVRQSLGAVMLKAGKAKEAEIYYRQDLKKNPNNGWSLMGLASSLEAQNQLEEARQVKLIFDKAWQDADVELMASTF